MNAEVALRFVYTTLGSREEASVLAETLVSAQLAACVNIVGPMISVYQWQGEIENDEEFALWIKTTALRIEDTLAALADAHPYDTPAIAVFDAEPHGDDYRNWLTASTGGAGQDS